MTSFAVGTLYGVGVGPGPYGLVPLAAYEAVRSCDLIVCPRASHKEVSVARQCVRSLGLPEDKMKDVAYNMDFTRTTAGRQYAEIAKEIISHLDQGQNVAYLTIGDTLTYSTYCYLLKAMRSLSPDFKSVTFPGITSFSTVAASFNWPLGLGRERVLILPCPDEMSVLEEEIINHDVVVLMKIGSRLESVVACLKKLKISQFCVFAHRIGLPDQSQAYVNEIDPSDASGYLSTILIRKKSVDDATQGV